MAKTRLSTENTESDRVQMRGEKSSGLPIIFPWTTGERKKMMTPMELSYLAAAFTQFATHVYTLTWLMGDSAAYKSWWILTVFAAAFTAFLETFQIAFSSGWDPTSGSAILDYILIVVFFSDMIINFNLAYYDERSKLVYGRRDIARNYMKFWFWIDLVGVFPFYITALVITGKVGAESTVSDQDPLNFLRLFKLARLVRLHRVLTFFSLIKYSRKISFVAYTLMRNFSAAVFWCHLWACIMYFIARMYSFDPENTWIGSSNSDLSGFDRYILSLYWSVVTFSTTGYGDWSPVNSVEQIFCMIYLMLNVVIMAWLIGSMTLLIVKDDAHTSLYRDTLQMLYKYAELHDFNPKLTKRLKTQLRLGFKSRDLADEQVLRFFPAAVRRKILRKLYLPSLLSTNLMKETRQQFVDSFLSLCSVEIFSPGEELLQRGSISADLYLLIDGTVEASKSTEDEMIIMDESDLNTVSQMPSLTDENSEIDDSTSSRVTGRSIRKSGDFLNELCFFTESPESDTIRTRTACQVLAMSRSHYKGIAADHPGSAGVVLRNLLDKYGDRRKGLNEMKSLSLNVGKSRLVSWDTDVDDTQDRVHKEKTVAAIRELIEMHINKQKDEHTTWFCFAASRGDTATISTMCDQGFDPNSSDYDKRTALMVASMKGNFGVVAKLLEYHANPNLTDVHGNSALFEATKNNHDDVAEMLLKNGGELSMCENLAATTLCQAVYDGDILMLKRLLDAKIQVNASDYDKRTAAHIAASEGNVAAFKLLVEAGADLSLEDRWGNTIRSEAEKAKSGRVLAHLDTFSQIS